MRYYLFIFILYFNYSCTDDTIVTNTHDLGGEWPYSEVLKGQLTSSGKQINDIKLKVKFSESFPFENLYIKYHFLEGKDTIAQDILSIPLQNDLGQWKGNRNGEGYSIFANLFTFDVPPNSSNLEYYIEQYSRERSLPGIDQIDVLLE